MDTRTSRAINREEIQFATEWLTTSPNPVHRELYYLLTQGYPVGTPIKEEKTNEQA